MDLTTTSFTLDNRTDNTVCPVARTARIISGKWTLLIIRDLASGVKRFNQLERSLQGISPKTLSERLRSLEEEGVILRQTFAEVPPRVGNGCATPLKSSDAPCGCPVSLIIPTLANTWSATPKGCRYWPVNKNRGIPRSFRLLEQRRTPDQ